MEEMVKHPTRNPQQELLQQYCSEAEALINTASSAEQAKQFSEQICSEFQSECESELVMKATRTYIDDIIARLFGVEK